MNRPAVLPVPRRSIALASSRSQVPLPGGEPVPPGPSLPPDVVPPPLDIPPQVPPEIREPDRPGEHLPITAHPRFQPATRH